MRTASDLRAGRGGGDHIVDMAVDDKSPLVSTLSLYFFVFLLPSVVTFYPAYVHLNFLAIHFIIIRFMNYN